MNIVRMIVRVEKSVIIISSEDRFQSPYIYKQLSESMLE